METAIAVSVMSQYDDEDTSERIMMDREGLFEPMEDHTMARYRQSGHDAGSAGWKLRSMVRYRRWTGRE